MAGKPGMHRRASTSPAIAEAIRARIKAGVIVDRLTKYVLGEIKMSSAQVAAGLGLLRKVVPDLSNVEVSGEVETHWVVRLPDVAPDSETWATQVAPRLQQ